MKPKLLIIELWGLGDLVIATPFIRAASAKFSVSVVAKPYAQALQQRWWPDVRVFPCTMPWTAFTDKYWLWSWPWQKMLRMHRTVVRERFAVGLSSRWDPRDHFLLKFGGISMRLGFPRLGSQVFLTHSLARPDPCEHRYEYWRVLGQALALDMPAREEICFPHSPPRRTVLIHTGAGQAVRVWALERYHRLVQRLRAAGWEVIVACDANQRPWWVNAGETSVATPNSVTELLELIDRASAFLGNDSGPGHLAAFSGVPTFTIFGPQLPEWFAPLHPRSGWTEGKACPYKPCSDYCRFPAPRCLDLLSEEEVWLRVQEFLARNTDADQGRASSPKVKA